MTTINITNFRKKVFDYISQTIEFNEVVNESTKNGNDVIISESDYNAMLETLHILSVPGLIEEIKSAGETPLSECVSESEVTW